MVLLAGRRADTLRQARGLDFRGQGAYVIAPPSLHWSGARYHWLKEPGVPLPPLPEWFSQFAAEGAGLSGQRPPVDVGALLWEGVPEGERDVQLFRLSATLRGAGVDFDSACEVVAKAAARCQPPFEDWRTKVESAFTRYPSGVLKPDGPLAASESDSDERSSLSGSLLYGADSYTSNPNRVTVRHFASARLTQNDHGNALRLVARHGADIRYVAKMGRWLVWDGLRWQIDDKGRITQLMRETVEAIFDEVKDRATDVEEKKRIVVWAVKSGSGQHISEAIRLAQSDPYVVSGADALDAKPWLLNVLNGTLDLRTGELRPHNRADLITKLAPVVYGPKAEAPLWAKFLDRIFAGNAKLIDFHQRAVGYSLTGDASERVLFIQYGRGKNGKSTFLLAIRAVLGDYAGEAPAEMLLAKRGDRGVPNDVARLPGTRFVAAKETEDGKRLDEARVKELTGNEPMSARFMHREWFDFRPQFKLWLATNYKPEIRGTDDGIWDRIRLLPYMVRIPDDEVDHHLDEKLAAEAPGILAWAVPGLPGVPERRARCAGRSARRDRRLSERDG